MPVAEARLERRKLDPFGQELSLFAQVAHRVVGERLERLGDAAALLGQRPFKLSGIEDAARSETGAVPVEAGTAHGEHLALVHRLEEIGAGSVDQAHTSADECERAGVRKAAGLRLCDVDDNADAGLDQLFSRDTVEVRVIDDRDVLRREALDQVLRAPIELCAADQLGEGHDD